jgi:Uma2 family endonuclease
MSTLSTTKLTAEQFLMLGEDPPGVRLELVSGEIVLSPSPTADHSDTILALAELLRPYIRKNRLGRLLADVDTLFSNDTVRRPDLLFVSQARLHIIKKVVSAAPDLCIEVTSPSTATDDRVEKFRLYAESGVKHYWIFDPHARMAEAFALKNGEYVPAGTARDRDVVKFPPFPRLAIRLAEIWPKA